jgi:leucyl-tRNA synthetase
MIYCSKCGWNPVPEDQLPVLLPDVERYEPTETGESPLANIPGWADVRCPGCDGSGRRETDTMPNWAGSDWYFLRYCDPHNSQALADLDKLRYWMPVDVYIGGDEHNTLHLLYSRFIYLFLHDLGVVPPKYPEPYLKRLSHGVILGPDGQRMSKSRGNVIVPQEYVERYGADALRVYLLFMGPYDATMAWNERALLGVKRFLDRYGRFVRDHVGQSRESGLRVKSAINRLGREVAEDTASFKYNTAIAHMMETLNRLQELVESTDDPRESVADQELRTFSQILAPYAPFTAESCWQLANGDNSVHYTTWPAYDPALELEELVTIAIQVNGKLRGTVAVPHETPESEIRHLAEAQPGVAKFLTGGHITRVIYVPMRTMNFVVR